MCNSNGKMPPPKNHEVNRAMVCALCIREHGEKAKMKINAKEEKQVVDEKIIPHYSSSNPLLPCEDIYQLSLSPWAHIFLEIFQ